MCDVSYSFGHADTSVADREGLVGLVGNDVDAEIFARVELAWVRERFIANLIQGIGGVGN